MNLYDLTERYLAINDMLVDSIDEEGAIDPDVATAFRGIEDDYKSKLSACCRIVKNLSAFAEATEAEEKRLRAKKQTLQRRVDSLKSYMLESLRQLGESKIVADELFTVAIQANPPAVAIDDMNQVPAEYDAPQERKLDMRSILAAIKQGVEVCGARVFHGSHLRIR